MKKFKWPKFPTFPEFPSFPEYIGEEVPMASPLKELDIEFDIGVISGKEVSFSVISNDQLVVSCSMPPESARYYAKLLIAQADFIDPPKKKEE